MTTVFIEDLQFHAYHGITSEERKVGLRFRLDILASVDETASSTDSINETVDYAKVARFAVAVCLENPLNTVERAAKVVADRLMAEFPTIASVRVRLAKLQPAIELTVGMVGVELTVDRVDRRS